MHNFIVYNAGESPADERSLYVTNSTMAELAKNLNGIVVVMEHRFYGKSLPAPVSKMNNFVTINKQINKIYVCVKKKKRTFRLNHLLRLQQPKPWKIWHLLSSF